MRAALFHRRNSFQREQGFKLTAPTSYLRRCFASPRAAHISFEAKPLHRDHRRRNGLSLVPSLYLLPLLTISFLITPLATAAPNTILTGTITRVIDGDTVELSDHSGALTKLRLAQIDTPESAQPYGKEATAALLLLVRGKAVRAEVVDVDRYGRSVVELYVGGVHVNDVMVREGHAWAYTRYVKSLAIVAAEDDARLHKRGLWKLPRDKRDAPWVWRQQRRSGKRAPAEVVAPPESCEGKRTCKEMTSCVEARFYLEECGVGSLDGDGDGVPCERMCQ